MNVNASEYLGELKFHCTIVCIVCIGGGVCMVCIVCIVCMGGRVCIVCKREGMYIVCIELRGERLCIVSIVWY